MKSRMETFWYRLAQVRLEKWPFKRRERDDLKKKSKWIFEFGQLFPLLPFCCNLLFFTPRNDSQYRNLIWSGMRV